MADLRSSLRRALAVCLAIGAACGALFGLALLVTAATGHDTPSSFLLGGFGFILLVFSALLLVRAVSQWLPRKPGHQE